MERITIILDHPDLIGEDRLAQVIGCKKKTLSRWRKNGLPFHQEQRTITYQITEVLEWLQRYRKPAAQRTAMNIKSLTINHA